MAVGEKGLKRTHFGRYGEVRNTPCSSMSKALQMSSTTLTVAVAVRQMTRSALISWTKRATEDTC